MRSTGGGVFVRFPGVVGIVLPALLQLDEPVRTDRGQQEHPLLPVEDVHDQLIADQVRELGFGGLRAGFQMRSRPESVVFEQGRRSNHQLFQVGDLMPAKQVHQMVQIVADLASLRIGNADFVFQLKQEVADAIGERHHGGAAFFGQQFDPAGIHVLGEDAAEMGQAALGRLSGVRTATGPATRRDHACAVAWPVAASGP